MTLSTLVVYSVWLISEILINRLMRSGIDDQKGKDSNSLQLIWLAVAGCVCAGIYIANATPCEISDKALLTLYAGLAVIVLGMILRILIVFSLGRNFTADVTIRQDHKLKTNGFYKYVRHPSYAASLLSFVGFGISLNNWISLILMGITILTVFSYRINVEENALVAHFGKDYLSYRKKTKKFIPFIY